MTQVLVVGLSPKTRYAIRQALGHQQIDIAGVLDAGGSASVRYGLSTDSGATPFKGSIEVGDDTVTLAGRYGRGGLRHDTVPLLRSDSPESLKAAGEVDVVLVAEGWSTPVPGRLLAGDPAVVQFGVATGVAGGDTVTVPAAHLTGVSSLVRAVQPLSEVELVVFTVVGVSRVANTDRGRLLALRGVTGGACAQPSTSVLPGVDAQLPVLGTEILGLPSEVTTTAVTVTLASATDLPSVLRRLKAESRGAFKGVLEVREEPVTSADALGSLAAVVDASSVTVDRCTVSLSLHTHTRAFEAARACALLSSPGR